MEIEDMKQRIVKKRLDEMHLRKVQHQKEIELAKHMANRERQKLVGVAR